MGTNHSLVAFLLLAIRFGFSSIKDVDNMIFKVLSFITTAARDCMIRAKDVMMNVNTEQQPANSVLELDRRVIALAMGYYH